MIDFPLVLAYDVGGSHARAGIVEDDSLSLRCANSAPIDSDGTAIDILNELFALGERTIAQAVGTNATIEGIAIAMPGPFDYENGISLIRHKFASLFGMNMRRAFADRFGIQEDKIVYLNDAQAFLLGEIAAGAAKGFDRSVGVTLGTGVGSAFSVGSYIVESGDGVPDGGEIYALPWDGQTVEETISTRGIQRRYLELTGADKSVRDICLTAHKDHNAAQVMNEFGCNLGRVLFHVGMPFRPDVIVLGGAISRSADLFLPAAIGALGSAWDCELRVSRLFDDAPLIGAAVRGIELLASADEMSDRVYRKAI